MASKKITAMPDLAGGQVPTDLLTAVDLSEPVSTQNVKTTFNDTFAEITKNVTDLSIQFANGLGTATVSAANKGKIRYNSTAQSFQVSENGGAYQNLLKGSGTATRVAFWDAADEIGDDANFYWDDTNKRLGIGVGSSPGLPIDVLSDALAAAQQWRENAGATRVQMLVPSGFGLLGTSTNDDMGFMANNTQFINLEATGGTVFGNIVPATGTVMVNALNSSDVAIVGNNAAGSSTDILKLQVAGSNRFRLLSTGEAIFGLASTITGKLTLSNASGATLTSISAGNAASTLNFIWPVVDPTVGQVLSAAAPSGGNVVLSWSSGGGGGTPANPNGSVQFNNSGSFGGDANALWDDTNNQLLIGGIALAAGGAPIDVVSDGSAIAQQWREAGAGTARVQLQIPASFGQIGTSSNHDFAILTNDTQRINVEASGAVVIGSIVAATAELMVNSLATGSISLIANNTAATSVDIARLQVNATNRFRFLNTGESIWGTASALSGKLTFQAFGNTNTQSIQAADSPASIITYKLPTSDPTAGQFLQASAPSSNIVTLTWASAVTSPSAPNGSVQFNNSSAFDGDAGLLWSTANQQLLVGGIALASGNAPVDVVADALATAQQWRETGGGATRIQLLVPSGFGLFGASSNDDMGFMANNTEYIHLEATGGTVFGSIVPATGTVMVNALVNTDVAIVGNNASGSTTDILKLQVAGSNRFRLLSTGEAIFGLASTITGKLTLSNASGATLTSISAGNAASTLNFIWPVVDPSAGQVLSASAPSGSNVTLSWTTTTSGTTINPTDTFFPYRLNATTFDDSPLVRASSTLVRVSNTSTGRGSILIGNSTDSLTGLFTIINETSATNATVNIARLSFNSTGTVAAGVGGILSFGIESSTTEDQTAANEQWFWNNVTHATRTAALSWSLANNGAVTEYMRLTTAGGGGTFVNTAACLAVHDGTAPLIWTAGSFAAKLYLLGASGTVATAVTANFSNSTVAGAVYSFLRGRGTNASPTAIQTADVLGDLEWWGQYNTSTNNVVAGCRIRCVSTETWANGANGSGLFFYTSPTGSTIASVMSLENTGTLRIGASSGSFNSTTKLQVANYASWNTDVTAAFYSGANGNKVAEFIGTSGQTADLIRVFRDSVTPDLFKVQSSLGTVVRVGQGTNAADYAYVGGNIKTNTTAVSNSGTTQTDLITYSLRANSLGTNGDRIEIEAGGTFDNTVATKTLTMAFGGTTIFSTTGLLFGEGSWQIRATVIRTGSATQISMAVFSGDVTLVTNTAQETLPTETLSSAITIKCTGQSSDGSNQITQDYLTVKWFPNGQ